MMKFNQLFPQILSAYVGDRNCLLSNSQCNELSKYVEGLEQKVSAAQSEAYLQALDDVMENIPSVIAQMTQRTIGELRSDYIARGDEHALEGGEG